MEKTEKIIEGLNQLFPDAYCQLNHRNSFELLIAVVLSAQTTDERVNSVSGELFEKYGNAQKLANASQEDIERIIRPIGLYRMKAKNIISLAKVLVDQFNGIVPDSRADLESLPGVGRKTANVILSNCFDVPAFAVDTHVSRVSKRLRIADENDDVDKIEEKLMSRFPEELWGKLHHQFIFFGRYKCKARNPECDNCPFRDFCTYFE